ncbi:MAG: apolipoprotein N-acyltransferase [Spirochaetaceae bacterium]|jgi:apolipoprotein N-acyltransferase|nr:apolipoprotein N-acyltransferase [Spirochaetaceae bacterium]
MYRNYRIYSAPVLAAILLTLAIPSDFSNWGFAPLGFVALAPYFFALYLAHSAREAAACGFIFGGLFHAASCYWLAFFHGLAVWTLGLTTLFFAILQCLAALLIYAVSAVVAHKTVERAVGFMQTVQTRDSETDSPAANRRPSAPNSRTLAPDPRIPVSCVRPFLTAAIWTLWEYLKSSGSLGFPWGLIPYSLSAHPILLQSADIAGVWGLSFMLALSCAVLAETADVLRLKILAIPRRVRILPNRIHPLPLYTQVKTTPHYAVCPQMTAGLVPAAIILMLIFTCNFLYGVLHTAQFAKTYSHPPAYAQEQSVFLILIQPNTDFWTDGEEQTLQSAMSLSRAAISHLQEVYGKNAALPPSVPDSYMPALLVWPETVLQYPYVTGGFYSAFPPDDPLESFSSSLNASLLTGAPAPYKDGLANAALLIEKGYAADFYAKRQLIPFAEYIPLQKYRWMRWFMGKIAGFDSSWEHGSSPNLMQITGINNETFSIGTPICFEDAFGPLCVEFFSKTEGSRADILVNLTNDSWSNRTSAEYQHLAAARFRAIENRAVLARAATSGITAVINAKGNIVRKISPFTPSFIVTKAAIKKKSGRTFYQKTGDWLPLYCAIFVAGFFLHLLARILSAARPVKTPGNGGHILPKIQRKTQ